MKMKNMRKKSVAILAGLAIAGTVGASAASLGGIGGDDLGADAAAVESCDTDGVVLDYSYQYDATAAEYLVSSVDVTAVNAACAGQDYALNLTLEDDAGDISEVETTGASLALTDNAFTVTLASPVSAEQVVNAALVISGAPV